MIWVARGVKGGVWPGKKKDPSDPSGGWQFCKEDHWCPGGGANLSMVCPDGKYSLPGSDNVSQCLCPPYSSSVRKSTNVSVCTCNPGYYQVANAGYQLSGWQCQVCQPDDYCYNGLNVTCPPKSHSGPGVSDYMQCACNAGYMNATVQSADSLCQDCPAGSFCTGGGLVEACVANAFSPTQTANSSSCTCNLGYAGVRNAPCVPCASPNYCYGGLVATCPAGTQAANLSWALSNCTCSAGRYGAAGQWVWFISFINSAGACPLLAVRWFSPSDES